MVLYVLLIFSCSNKKENNFNEPFYSESFIWTNGDLTLDDNVDFYSENSINNIYDSIIKLGFKENRIDIGQSLCGYKYNTTAYDYGSVKEIFSVGIDCEQGIVNYYHKQNEIINSNSYNTIDLCDSLSKVLFDVLETCHPYDYGQGSLDDTVIEVLGQSTDLR